MNQEQVKGLFALAGIPILKTWESPNKYWPKAYIEQREKSPWWLIKTPYGLIEIGWRKRVIHIDWSDTRLRKIITEDEVSRDEEYVHAWGYDKAVQYLTELKWAFKEMEDSDIPEVPEVLAQTEVEAFLTKELQISRDLGVIIGDHPRARTEVTKDLWKYIKAQGLQDLTNRHMVNADDKLYVIFNKPQVSIFEMTKLVAKHLYE